MFEKFIAAAVTKGPDIAIKVLGAIALWVIGKLVIRVLLKAVDRGGIKRKVDATLISFLHSFVSIALNLLLILAVLSIFGVETASFAGVLAGAGVAIGMAWSGILGNFAAGVFMVVLRPIRVGDFVEAGGVVGTVEEVGIIVTVITTMDNVRTIVGNTKVFGGTIKNYSANPYRRVELKAQLAHGADYVGAMELLREALKSIPNTADVAPEVEILEFNLAGPVLAVRPFCHNDHYWDVYFETNRRIRSVLGEAGFPVPETHHALHTLGVAQGG